jgi:hypothetical protein
VAAVKLVVATFSCGTGLNVSTFTSDASWLSVTAPVDPTKANASCFGTPSALSHVDDG